MSTLLHNIVTYVADSLLQGSGGETRVDGEGVLPGDPVGTGRGGRDGVVAGCVDGASIGPPGVAGGAGAPIGREIGRASCRERV